MLNQDSGRNIISEQMLYDARSRLLNTCLFILLIVGYLVIPTYIKRIIEFGWQPVSIVHFIILSIGTPIIIFRKKLSVTTRAIAMLGISFASAFAALMSFGIIGSGFFGMAIMGCTVAALTLGRIPGLAALFLSTAFYITVMIFLFNGSYSLPIDAATYGLSRTSWIMALSGYILPLLLLIFGIDEMHKILKDFIQTIIYKSREIQDQNFFRSALFDSTDALLLVTDNKGIIIELNRACSEATGLTKSDVQGKSFADIFLSEVNNDLNIIAESPSPRRENLCPSKNGRELIVNWGAKPVTLHNNEVTHYIISGVDVTENRNLEKKLRHSQKLESIGKLAGGIAHDFNNMLTGIMGSAELLSSRLEDSSNLKKFSNTIIDTSRRASSLTRQLLSFARIESGPSELIDINSIIRDTIKLLERSIKGNIKITSSLPDSMIVINGEAAQIINALLNLGMNSRDAITHDGIIDYSVTVCQIDEDYAANAGLDIVPGNYALIKVTDNGTGIPREFHDRIFDPFFTTKSAGEGTGLGLSSVYGTIKRHAGTVKFYSEPGAGTTFSIYLPVISKELITEDSLPPEEIEIQPWRIMAIDDEDAVRENIAGLLTDFTHQVTTAVNGKDALNIFSADPEAFDLIILDWIMPVMNGEETLTSIRKIRPDIPVIISSGFGVNHEKLKIIEKTDRVKFLAKPYRQEELLQMIYSIQKESYTKDL